MIGYIWCRCRRLDGVGVSYVVLGLVLWKEIRCSSRKRDGLQKRALSKVIRNRNGCYSDDIGIETL
jgi:hypothetical protein